MCFRSCRGTRQDQSGRHAFHGRALKQAMPAPSPPGRPARAASGRCLLAASPRQAPGGFFAGGSRGRERTGPALAVRPRPMASRRCRFDACVLPVCAQIRGRGMDLRPSCHALRPCDGGIEACWHLGYAGAGDVPSGWHRSRPLQAPCPKKEHLPVWRLALARLQMLSFCVRAAPCRQQAVAMMHV